jgi:anti-sigma regulatory factor (Ser/Thr protein kinase)
VSRGDRAGPLGETAASDKAPGGSQEEGTDALLPLPVLWLDQVTGRTDNRDALVSTGPALPRVPAPVPRFRARYPATALSVRVLRGEVEAVARECGLAGEALGDVRLAVSEAATNAVVHGSSRREDAHIDLVVELTELEILVTVSDSGNGLRPSSGPAGLQAGLSIIAMLTGHLDLRSSDEGTEVRMAFLRSGEVVDPADGLRQLEDAANREREDAVQRLDSALVEQDRLGELLDEAVGTSTELRAYVRLQVAGEEVAARQAWVNWIETASHRGLARAQLAEFALAN